MLLDWSDRGITSLQDYSPDTDTSQVINLIISDNPLSTLVGLERFPLLENLICVRCNLTSLDGVNSNLITLTCSNNSITSLQPLQGCKNLGVLFCDSNSLTSLEGLEDCKKLLVLSVYYNPLVSIQGLSVNPRIFRYREEDFPPDYQVKERLEYLNLLSSLTKMRRLVRVITYQRLYRDWYYSHPVRYKGGETNRLCFSDLVE